MISAYKTWKIWELRNPSQSSADDKDKATSVASIVCRIYDNAFEFQLPKLRFIFPSENLNFIVHTPPRSFLERESVRKNALFLCTAATAISGQQLLPLSKGTPPSTLTWSNTWPFILGITICKIKKYTPLFYPQSVDTTYNCLLSSLVSFVGACGAAQLSYQATLFVFVLFLLSGLTFLALKASKRADQNKALIRSNRLWVWFCSGRATAPPSACSKPNICHTIYDLVLVRPVNVWCPPCFLFVAVLWYACASLQLTYLFVARKFSVLFTTFATHSF